MEDCEYCISIVDDASFSLTKAIKHRLKTVETRSGNVFKGIVGKRVNVLMKYGKHDRYKIGTAVIGKPVWYLSADEFDADFDRHQIAPGNRWHKDYGVGYELENLQLCIPKLVTGKLVGNRSYFRLIE